MDEIDKNAIHKNILWSIDAVNNFKKETAYHVESKNVLLENTKAFIKYKANRFCIRIICHKHPSAEIFKNPETLFEDNLIFSKSDKLYEVDSDSISVITQTLSDPFIIQFRTKTLKTKVLEQEIMHRLISPTKTQANFDPFLKHKIKIGSILYYGLIKVRLGDNNYECYYYENKDLKKHYIIIDSMNNVTTETFKAESDAILFTISLFTGNLYKDERYILTFESEENSWKNNSIEFEALNGSLLTNAQMVHPHKFKDYLEHVNRHDLINSMDMQLSLETFSIICSNILIDKNIQRIITLLLEGNAAKSILLRSSIYSLALETLTNIIYSKNKNKLNPISDTKLEKKIISKMIEALNEYETFLDTRSFVILTNRIQAFNKPTNSDKLEKSFQLYGIKLNNHDKEILKYRNIFLHGSSPVKDFEESIEKKIDLSLISNKLHLLVNCLLFKYLGYRGHVTNHFAFAESKTKEFVSEHYFRVL